MKLSEETSGAFRTFTYFLWSGSHHMLAGYNYLPACLETPSAMEMVYAIFSNVLEIDDEGRVLNFEYAQKRATDYLKSYLDPAFKVSPEYEDWEMELY